MMRKIGGLIVLLVFAILFSNFVFAANNWPTVRNATNTTQILFTFGSPDGKTNVAWTVPADGSIYVDGISADPDSYVVIDKIDVDGTAGNKFIVSRDLKESDNCLKWGILEFCKPACALVGSNGRCVSRDSSDCILATDTKDHSGCFVKDSYPVKAGDKLQAGIVYNFVHNKIPSSPSQVKIFYATGSCVCSLGQTQCDNNNLLNCTNGCTWEDLGVKPECSPIPGGRKCSAENQTIIRLSSATNAHGEVADSDVYGVPICYDSIFGEIYTGEEPNECTDTNRVLSLSDSTNAHASVLSDLIYDVDVCYGNLVCVNTTGSCPAGYNLTVSLSSNSNAHLANDSSYPVKICCKKSTGQATGAYWANMIEQRIDSADLRDAVKLKVNATGFSADDKFNFTIYKTESSAWRRFLSFITFGLISGTTTTSIPIGTNNVWIAGQDSDGVNSSGVYYFKAVAEDGSNEVWSNNLTVNLTLDNSRPHAEILKPVNGGIYLINNSINFEQNSYDVDSLWFNYTWDFGDGNAVNGSSLDYINYNTTHNYNGGSRGIDVETRIVDNQGSASSDSVSIVVVNLSENGLVVFADIFKPSEMYHYTSKNADFNGSTSWAIRINNGVITCVAGPCPSQTQDNFPITGTPQPITNLAFNWTIYESGSTLPVTYSGIGFAGAEFVKIFSNPATSLNPHRIILNLSLEGNHSDDLSRFTMSFSDTNLTCLQSDSTSGWYNPETNSTNNSMQDCYKVGGISNSGDGTCCPRVVDPVCSLVTRICGAGVVEGCDQYKTSTACGANSGNPAVAVPEIADYMNAHSSNLRCGVTNVDYGDRGNCHKGLTDCKCAWNATISKCFAVYNETVEKSGARYIFPYPVTLLAECSTSGGGGTTIPPGCGMCIISSDVTDDCNITQTRTISWSSVWQNPDPLTCTQTPCLQDITVTESCLGGTLLSFVSDVSLVIAVLVLIIFYLIIRRKSKNASKTKKKKRR